MKKYRAPTLILAALMAFMSGCASHSDKNLPYKKLNEIYAANKVQAHKSNTVKKGGDIPNFAHLKKFMAPGHLFYLYHPSDEKLQGKFRADFNGYLRLPYNIRINIKQMTFSQLREKVQKYYAKYFQAGVEKVTFTLRQKTYWLEVRGLVKKSGRILVFQNESLDKVIDTAGGVSGKVDKEYYTAAIKQRGMSYSINLNQFYQSTYFGKQPQWIGGDEIFIKKDDASSMDDLGTQFVNILGGVRNPGKVFYNKNANIFYYLAQSGGIIDNLDLDEAYIIRMGTGGLQKITFQMNEMQTIPVLYPNDIIMLQADRKSMGEKVLDTLVQVASLISTVALLILAL